MASAVSTLPWTWVIEALASFKQVDASILIDLVKRTPEISDDLGKNAREMVSLRILESFFARHSGSTEGGSATDSKMELDPSEHCEDVVRDILHEMSASDMRRDEPEMFKWNVQSFIMNKRASLPKCTLEQLKDAILEGNHPILASLKERSGLSIGNQSRNKISMDGGGLNLVEGTLVGNLTSPINENLDGLLREETPNRTLSSSKRDRIDFDTEDLAAKSLEDGICMDDVGDSHLHNAKKLKQNATLNGQAIGQNSVPVIENESEDLHRRNGQHTIRDGCYLVNSSHVGGSEESTFSEDSHDHYIALKRHGQRNDEDASGLQPNNPHISCNNDIMPRDSCRDEPQQDLPDNETKDYGKQFAEMGTSYAAPIYETHRNNCSDEARDKSEKSQLNSSKDASPINESYQNNFYKDTKDDFSGDNPGREMSSDSDGCQDEKIDLALKKQTFLSSQCTFSQDSLTTANCAELQICMKCNKGGQLLVCSGSACLLVVHQSCLGSAAPNFDDSGRFYCHFCTYSHAISEYLELKKKAAVARSDLAVFIGLETGHRVYKRTKCFFRQEQNQFIQDENVKGNRQSNYITEVNSSQYVGNIEDKQQVEPSVSCVNDNLPCQEEGAAINDGTPGALFEGGVGKLGQQCQTGSVLKGQQNEEPDGCHDCDDNNSTCRDREIGHETKGCAEDVMQKEVSLQDVSDSSRQPAYVPNICVEESSGEENDKSSNYAITLRRREKQENQYSDPTIFQLRRKKVSWTTAEEETLKEGVRRFSSIHDRIIPWKRILEFGSDVFQKGRTTIDLKDKWRNICKGSPRSK